MRARIIASPAQRFQECIHGFQYQADFLVYFVVIFPVNQFFDLCKKAELFGNLLLPASETVVMGRARYW